MRGDPWDIYELGTGLYDFKDKEASVRWYILYMLNRTQSMFEYHGLPETIPQNVLEFSLQTGGYTAISEIGGQLYALLRGSLGGPPNPYYFPTQYIYSNPVLGSSKSLAVGEECVLVRNDTFLVGLLPLFRRYASQLVENDLTISISTIMARLTALLSSPDDKTRKAAETLLNDLVNGELGVVGEGAFLDGIKVQPCATSAGSNQITQLIELQQYLKAGWFNDLGLQSNYNMKREAINSNEAQLNEQSLLPLVDDMLRCRRLAMEEVNRKYGTNISVDLFSSWDVQHNDISGRTENPPKEQEEEPGEEVQVNEPEEKESDLE